jgi:hypothetical protein
LHQSHKGKRDRFISVPRPGFFAATARFDYSASSPVCPVRMRMACSSE